MPQLKKFESRCDQENPQSYPKRGRLRPDEYNNQNPKNFIQKPSEMIINPPCGRPAVKFAGKP
jgi:hypothetical protein